jgi:GT2 family glycosyltransferase
MARARADALAPEDQRVQLDVVIVSYRCEDLLRRCLRSLREGGIEGATTTWVIDNASADGTAEMVAREFPEARLIVNGRNAGFAAASNQGIRMGAAPYVLLLNPDTALGEQTLERLLSVMETRATVGASGPQLLTEDGSPDHAAKRSFPTPLSALGHFTGLGRRAASSSPLAQYTAPMVEGGAVDAINGAFMLLRREALESIGLFDEGYWMYMEDLDLCYRLWAAGWTVWYEPEAIATHVKGGSSGSLRSPRLNFAFHYGMQRFYRRHYAKARNPLLNLTVYLGIWLKLGASIARTAITSLSAGARRAVTRETP